MKDLNHPIVITIKPQSSPHSFVQPAHPPKEISFRFKMIELMKTYLKINPTNTHHNISNLDEKADMMSIKGQCKTKLMLQMQEIPPKITRKATVIV